MPIKIAEIEKTNHTKRWEGYGAKWDLHRTGSDV